MTFCSDFLGQSTLPLLVLKLKLQSFGHLKRRADSFEKTLMLGKIEGEGDDRGWDGWMALLTQWTWVWVDSGSWWWTGRPGVLRFMGSQRVWHDWATELNWTLPLDLKLLTVWGYCVICWHIILAQCWIWLTRNALSGLDLGHFAPRAPCAEDYWSQTPLSPGSGLVGAIAEQGGRKKPG